MRLRTRRASRNPPVNSLQHCLGVWFSLEGTAWSLVHEDLV
jgi:hypothetical protein